ncbi:MAG: hypothetical protein C5B60_00420 [Chloroflexi bacterium]|nr:MAG: hypothetical protein C5B60_00420 [Chloroflexota bacterium]
MMNQLSLLLRNRVALIAIGAVVVALVGAGVVAASSGAHLGPGSTTPAQCASEDFVSAHSGTPTGDRDETGEHSASGHKVHGEEQQCSGDDHDGDHDDTSGTRTPSAHSGD